MHFIDICAFFLGMLLIPLIMLLALWTRWLWLHQQKRKKKILLVEMNITSSYQSYQWEPDSGEAKQCKVLLMVFIGNHIPSKVKCAFWLLVSHIYGNTLKRYLFEAKILDSIEWQTIIIFFSALIMTLNTFNNKVECWTSLMVLFVYKYQ